MQYDWELNLLEIMNMPQDSQYTTCIRKPPKTETIFTLSTSINAYVSWSGSGARVYYHSSSQTKLSFDEKLL